ncbi:hypothetical protein [Culicoidibacter larvae]|uniref:Uncharacterized protein n=1 Tax=Culicoidibacter larvae TaxID=2579976 RepID=A0A5R8QH75_9FIRM|nr:hypothetical protein [Culicoidibacter larvae]TLG77332.1 hypothetical protein FEZ08_01560 [Culicoidibacter larvae]
MAASAECPKCQANMYDCSLETPVKGIMYWGCSSCDYKMLDSDQIIEFFQRNGTPEEFESLQEEVGNLEHDNEVLGISMRSALSHLEAAKDILDAFENLSNEMASVKKFINDAMDELD